MPVTLYTEAEYRQLRVERDDARKLVQALEGAQPVWATGHYHTVMALAQLWEMLGARNQTEAVQAVKRLKGE